MNRTARPKPRPRHPQTADTTEAPDTVVALAAGVELEPPPVDIEHASERRIGAIEAAAPRPDPTEGVAGFLEPDDAPQRDEPLLQPERGA